MTTARTTRTRVRWVSPAWIALAVLAAVAGVVVGARWHGVFAAWVRPAGEPDRSPGVATAAVKQLWTCGMHPQVIQDHPGNCPICHMKLVPLRSDPGAAGGTPTLAPAAGAAVDGNHGAVVIDPAMVQNMGVRTAEVVRGPLRRSLRFTAQLMEAEPGHRDINLRVSGWIQTLYANTDGMEVREGEPLFDLYSPELQLAIQELISARKAAASAGQTADPTMRATADSLIKAAEDRLVALGLSEDQVRVLGALDRAPEFVRFSSPINGHVTEKAGVYTGSSVTAGQRIMRLAERTTMWVEVQVPECDLGEVHVGQKASVRLDAYPGRTFDGEVIFIHPHLDEMTRTALARVQVENHDYALHQGMYATVAVRADGPLDAILAPREAIIDSGDSQVAFVDDGAGRFEPRRVTMGASGEGGTVEVLSGLNPGEHVVTSGEFLLDSESRLREAVGKFLHTSPGAGSASGAPAAGLDRVVREYLTLSETLGAIQTSDAPLRMDPLISALESFKPAKEQMRKLADNAGAAAGAMRGQPLPRQRDLFKGLSADLIELVESQPPSNHAAPSLFVLNCPMAKADWLQRTSEVANPYYADDMKDCGSVVRQIGSAPSDRDTGAQQKAGNP